MSKLTKKLLLSVLTVVLTVVALGTTTFAWFTLTNTATIQPFSADVVADAGIEVSLDDAPNENVWVTTLTTQMLQDYIALKYGQFYFNHVTSLNGRNFLTLDGGSVTAGVLEIGIRFRSDDATEIMWEEVALDSVGVNWTPDVTFEYTNGIINAGTSPIGPFKAANGIRMSVSGNIGGSTATTVYERPAGGDGTFADNTVLGLLTNANLIGAIGSVDYYTVKTSEPPLGAGDVTVVGTVTTLGAGIKVLDLLENDQFGTTYSGNLTIRIWLEGWDPDTFNAVLADIVTASFKFAAPE